MSDVRELCRKTYRAFIETQPIPTELRRALRTNERVPKFIDNMAAELQKVSANVKRETVIAMVEDMSRFFINAVVATAEQKAMSPIKRAMLKARIDAMNEFRREADELEKQGVNHVVKTEKGETDTTTTEIS